MESHLTLLILCLPLALANEAALQEFTIGNNLFTSEIYKEIVKNEPGNFLVSPLSVETILALTHSGAKDATAKELRDVLHLPKSQEKIESAVKSLQPVLRSNDPYILRSANKIYVKSDFQIKDAFKKITKEAFGADYENIDFTRTVAAAGTMNKWVEDLTEKKINNLISPTDLSKDTRTVLINALYFKGNWTNSFEKYQTRKAEFHTISKTVSVDTMHDLSSMKFYESPELDAKFLELPYEGNDVSLTVVLPNKKNGLADLEKNMSKVLQTPKYSSEFVNLALPKFKIESRLDFGTMLRELGVKKIFKADEADLSGIAGVKGALVINKVIQKTFIEVNEEGAEAAAATFVDIVVPLSGIVSFTPPKEFKADHPFMFYIKVKDLIIFAGRVVNPSQ